MQLDFIQATFQNFAVLTVVSVETQKCCLLNITATVYMEEPLPSLYPSISLSVQWLESIEVTKSALQQRMLDLESEKVRPFVPSSPPAVQMESEYLHIGLCNCVRVLEGCQAEKPLCAFQLCYRQD